MEVSKQFMTLIFCWHLRMMTLLVIGLRIVERNRAKRHDSELKIYRSLRLRKGLIRDDWLRDTLGNPTTCRELFRMSPNAFFRLCNILSNDGGLRETRWATVEERVAKFLLTIGHNVRHVVSKSTFRRSGETTSRHLKDVLRAIISIHNKFITQPDGSEVPLEIQTNNRFYPFFKDCVGALDGTHVRVKVSAKQAPRYRGRKDYPTTNVLVACIFNLRFTYVLVGWEGTAADSRIIKNALSRQHPLKIPEGKYYLVDAGYMLRSGLIPPYRGVRYHLNEYTRNAPTTGLELFNHRHSSLRNVVERCIGVLKKRFTIVGSGAEPHYRIKTQKQIVLACCVLHNYLMGVDPDDGMLAEVDCEIANQEFVNNNAQHPIDDSADALHGQGIRDLIAADMWLEYNSHHNT